MKQFNLTVACAVLALSFSGCATTGDNANNKAPTPAVTSTEGFTPAAARPSGETGEAVSSTGPAPVPSAVQAPSQAPGDLALRLTQMEASLQALQEKLDAYERGKKTSASGPKEIPLQKHPADEFAGIPGEEKIPPVGHTQNDPAIEKFRSARIQLESGKYSEAILAFTDFVNTNGDHVLAGPAQHLIGEAYFRQKEYRLAESEFKRVLMIYPRCSSVPETLARLTEVQTRLGTTADASQNRQKLLSLFPNSPAAMGFMNKTEIEAATPAPIAGNGNEIGAENTADADPNPKRMIPPATAPLPEVENRADGQAPAHPNTDNAQLGTGQ